MKKKPHPEYTDAKFKVVRDPNRRAWWQGWYIDWRNALIVTAISTATALGALLGR